MPSILDLFDIDFRPHIEYYGVIIAIIIAVFEAPYDGILFLFASHKYKSRTHFLKVLVLVVLGVRIIVELISGIFGVVQVKSILPSILDMIIYILAFLITYMLVLNITINALSRDLHKFSVKLKDSAGIQPFDFCRIPSGI